MKEFENKIAINETLQTLKIKMKCPKCKSAQTEEHGTEPGDYNWWLCRECGFNWPTKEC